MFTCNKECDDKMVCRCLGVTEADILEALGTLPIDSIHDLRARTGAGDGCMCCHKRLHQYLQAHQSAQSSVRIALGMVGAA